MSKRRKKFACGHSGFGSYCHRCEEKMKRIMEKKMEKEKRILYIDSNGHFTPNIPYNIQEKAVREFQKLNCEQHLLANLKAKRMTSLRQRNTIVIRIGRSHRLICEKTKEGFQWIELISHETYNNRLKMGGWDN